MAKQQSVVLLFVFERRNPRECAVAKKRVAVKLGFQHRRNPRECAVAKKLVNNAAPTAAESQPARMRCGKERISIDSPPQVQSQPALLRCGKSLTGYSRLCHLRRNPRECAEAKKHVAVSVALGWVATRANALRQSVCPILHSL